MKKERGITLIALIITIIVLLILAVVTINALNEGSIFAHANNAVTRYSEEAEKEQMKLSVAEWQIEKYYGTSETFLSYMQNKLSGIVNSSSDITESQGVLTVNTKNGNTYTITESGTITKVSSSGTGEGQNIPTPAASSISVTPTTLDLEVGGSKGILTATIIGDLNANDVQWSASPAGVVTISGEGAKATVTAVEAGTATITASCGSAEPVTVNVTVTNPIPSNALKFGMAYGGDISTFSLDNEGEEYKSQITVTNDRGKICLPDGTEITNMLMVFKKDENGTVRCYIIYDGDTAGDNGWAVDEYNEEEAYVTKKGVFGKAYISDGGKTLTINP